MGIDLNKEENAYFLNADVILKFLIQEDKNLDTIIIYNPTKKLVTTDYAIYEALASIQTCDNFDINKLKKFFEVVEVDSYSRNFNKEKPLLTNERVDNIRKSALEKGDEK